MFEQLLVLRTGHLSACGLSATPGLFAGCQRARTSMGARILGSCFISPVLHSVTSWDWSSVLLSLTPVKVGGDHFCFLSIAPEGSNLLSQVSHKQKVLYFLLHKRFQPIWPYILFCITFPSSHTPPSSCPRILRSSHSNGIAHPLLE